MLTNFIYAQSKAMFEERLAEVPNDAIVFIEDTKEIWTHGTYFDCSTLDPNIIPNLQMEIDELKGIVDNKAYTDGSYPNMTVGTAKDLYTVQNSAEFEFSHKISEVESESNIAKIENIKGNSVVWNQLINNILSGTTYQKAWYPRRGVNYASVQNGEIELRFDSQSDAFGNSLRQQIDVRPGDKIYVSYDYESHNVDEFGRRVFMAFTAGWSNKAALSDECLAKGGEVVGHAEGFSIVPSDNSINALCIYFCYTGITSPDTTPLKIANFRFVNLTRMFGAGNEPTTIEEYHSRIPQGIDIDAYNEGEVIHMNVDAVKSVGFNQWDEKWENGIISESTGEDYDSGYAFRSKNVIRVLPNMPYYFKKPIGVVTYLMFYDDDMNFVQWLDAFDTSGDGGVFTTPNAPYMRFVCYTETYNNDICINISDSEKNGIYEPYISRMQSLEILRKYFPNGMRSAGTAHDEIRYNKATQKWEMVQRIGVVDLGTLNWNQIITGANILTWYATVMSDMLTNPSSALKANILCDRYTTETWNDLYYGKVAEGIAQESTYLRFASPNLTSKEDVQSALQGVILYYELANPIVTEIQETFNLDYEVWNGGTEQAIAYVKSAPFKGTIKYGIDSALATIKNNSLEISNLKNRISTPDWNAREGEVGYIENRPFGFNCPTYLSDADEKTIEVIDLEYDRRKVTYTFKNYTFEYGIYMYARRITRDPSNSISEYYYKEIKSGDNVYILDLGDYVTLNVVYNDYTDDGYETVISIEGDNLFDFTLEDFEKNIILGYDLVSIRSSIPDLFIPDSIARKNEFTTINEQSITEGGNIDLVADGDEVYSLTLKPGCKIGSFSVDSSNNLASHDYEHVVISNNGITISSDDYVDYTTIKDGRLQITSERKDTPAMSIIGPNGIEIADPLRNQIDGYAIQAHDGMFAGLRPYVRVIKDSSSSSDKTLTELDHTILINSSSQQTITLPGSPKDGQEYTIMMALKDSTSVKHIISSGSANIFVPKEGNLKSSLTIDAHGCVKLIYVKDTGFW